MSEDVLGDVRAASSEPVPVSEPPRRGGSDYEAYQPERFRGHIVSRGIDWGARRVCAALSRVPLDRAPDPSASDVGASWAALLFYLAGAEPSSRAAHPGINAAVATGQYAAEGYRAHKAGQESLHQPDLEYGDAPLRAAKRPKGEA